MSWLGIAILCAGLAPVAAAAKAPKTDDEKTIYVLGVSLARQLGSLALKPDELDMLFAGIRDQVAGKPLAVSVDEYGPKIQQLAQGRSAAAAAEEKKASAAFLAAEAAAPGAKKLPSGLIKRVVKESSGASPTASDTVKVHYHGTLRDGTVFDSSVERGEPATFPVQRVIPCWTEALQTMKVGEKAHITCPPEIAYGDKGAPPRIKPGAALAFDVELLEIVKPAAGSAPAPSNEGGGKPAKP
jgi:FKBP-type peptidyl-prolyl cis-trans isomerase FkpA/FKBP-type peptidyl-prolyl cis-trans isomerase FklB